MPVVVAAGSGAVVQVGGLEVGSAAVAGEVADTVAVLVSAAQPDPAWVTSSDSRWAKRRHA